MHPIRVGFLSPSLYLGGAERWLVSLATGLDPAKCKVVGIALANPNAIHHMVANRLDDRIPIYHGLQHYRVLAELADVLINWGEGDLSSLADRNCQVVHVAQGQCPWTHACISKALPFVDRWVAVSEAAARVYPDPAKVSVLYNSVDQARCQVTIPRPEQRERWHALPHHVLIGYVGRPSDEKNPLAAVYAAKALGPPYRPLMIGGGPYAPAYHSMARRICQNVIIEPEVDQVGNVYNALDAMILASQNEGHSLALTEAWYCGCPTIATPVGATPELERDHGKLTTTLPLAHNARDLVVSVIAAVHPDNPCTARAKHVAYQYLTDTIMCRNWEAYLRYVVHSNSHDAIQRPYTPQVSNHQPPLASP